MAAQPAVTRASVCALLDSARRELLTSFEGLAEEQMEVPLPDGWSVKDILAHVAMWEEVAMADMRRTARGDKAALAVWDHSLTDQWNHIQFVLRKDFPLRQVLAELAEVRRGTLEVLDSIQEEHLASGFIPSTCAIHVRHDREHADQIRNWRQKQGV